MDGPWALPTCQQDECLLIQLPSEIRAIVLSHLLAYPDPLQYSPTPAQYAAQHQLLRYEFEWQAFSTICRPNFADQLHTNILSTCQLLYNDGSRILYEHNSLLIEIDFRMPTRTWWFVLGEEGPLNSYALRNYSSVLGYVKFRATKEPDPYEPHSRWMYGNIFTVLSRMQKFDVIMRGTSISLIVSQWTDQWDDSYRTLLEDMMGFFDEVTRGKVVRLNFTDVTSADLVEAKVILQKMPCSKLDIMAGCDGSSEELTGEVNSTSASA